MATQAERDALLIQQRELNDSQTAERKSHGTQRNSNEQVQRQSRSQSRSAMNGGKTVKNTSISPSKSYLDAITDNAPKAPDYYRDGFQRTKTVTDPFTGEEREIQVWEPVPELVGERKEPTLASIKLIDVSDISNTDPNNPEPKKLIPEYTKFFLDNVREAESEKFQIVETFNDFYTFFYGKKPPIYTFSGYLLNLINYNWWNEFMYYYENFWRGTKAVERNARIFLTYNYQQVQGYILNVNTNTQAVVDKGAPFSISMIVTKRLIFSGREEQDYISDSLLPRSETGFINTNADGNSRQLVIDYLQGVKPADDNSEINGFNRDESYRSFNESLGSSNFDSTLEFSGLSGTSVGNANANSLLQNSSLSSGLSFG